MKITAALPIDLPSTPNLREHWAARARRAREQRTIVRMALWTKLADLRREVLRHDRPRQPDGSIVVTLTRVGPRALDTDNLAGALKATRDAVADALGIDDGDARITWIYAQRRGQWPGRRVGRAERGVEIMIEVTKEQP